MSVRESFVAEFGEEDAAAIEAAAESHATFKEKGSDPFKWAICIAIGWDCITRYTDSHGIKASPEALKTWVVEHGDIGTHDGDVDYLAAFVGVYQDWIKKEEVSQ